MWQKCNIFRDYFPTINSARRRFFYSAFLIFTFLLISSSFICFPLFKQGLHEITVCLLYCMQDALCCEANYRKIEDSCVLMRSFVSDSYVHCILFTTVLKKSFFCYIMRLPSYANCIVQNSHLIRDDYVMAWGGRSYLRSYHC